MNLRIEFESDWHVGEGIGRPGDIDRIVRRNPEDGLPFIPAKTIVGIWRDSCETVARGLDDKDESGYWSSLVKLIFGHVSKNAREIRQNVKGPLAAHLSVTPALYDKALRLDLSSPPSDQRDASRQVALRNALTFVKSGVSLDEWGVSREDHLRMEEMAITGSTLMCQFELDIQDGSTRDAALALLWAGSLVVERIGGKRRRGAGRCKWVWNIPQERQAQFLKTLEEQNHSLPLEELTDHQNRSTSLPSPSDRWHRYCLEIRLKTPVIIADGVRGNIVYSRDYIPGTMILASMNDRLPKLIPGWSQSIANGTTQIRNAYLAHQNTRMIPAPLALYREKLEGSGKPNCWNFLLGEPEDNTQRKQIRGGYVSLELFEQVLIDRPETIITTHATIDDNSQRPTSDVGGVYSYEALKAGQTFISEIWTRTPFCDESFKETVKGEYRLGISRKDDYGLVEINVSNPPELSPSSPDPSANGNYLVLWLASPLLLRNASLQPTVDIKDLKRALEERLGKIFVDRDDSCISFQRIWRDDGWNSRWGIPRASKIGWAEGSCFRFETNREVQSEILSSLSFEGLGERRGEGFGEILFNPKLLKNEKIPLVQPNAMKESDSKNAPVEESSFTRSLERRATKLLIKFRSQQLAYDEEFRRKFFEWEKNFPSNSQLGAFRAQILALSKETSPLKDWIEHLKKVENRKSKWPKEALNKIEELSKNPLSAWTRIFDENNPPPLFTGRDSGKRLEELKNEMQVEALKSFCISAIQAEIKDREGKGLTNRK
jgi:CRISPR-associated protein Csx10